MGDWLSVGALLAVLAPLAGVPLTAILFYLRGLREQYAGRFTQLLHRVERLDSVCDLSVQRITEAERNCATREEWIRESMLARRERRALTTAVARLQAQVNGAGAGCWTKRIHDAARAVLAAAERMERACGTPGAAGSGQMDSVEGQPDG
jgi:hypothetical protein